MLGVLLSAVTFGLVVFALVDLITTENWAVKHLPKVMWVVIILILPLIGSLIWLVVGKDRALPESVISLAQRRPTSVTRPLLARESTPEDDEARVEAEIEYYENQARIRRLEEKLRAERDGRAGA